MSEQNTFIQALLEGKHSIRVLLAEFGNESDGETVDLSSLATDKLDELRGSRLTPPEPIRRYLDSGDDITDFTIDQMELAMEKAAGITQPFYITSMRSGGNGSPKSVDYFYLEKEEG